MSEATASHPRERGWTDEVEDNGSQSAAICPLCVTVTTGTDPDELHEKAETHNVSMHDGERVARAVKPKREHIKAFHSRVRRQYDRDVMADVAALIARADPWGGLDG